MHSESPVTFFASPERASMEEIEDALVVLKHNPIVEILEEAVQGYLMLLNKERQILAVNEELRRWLGMEKIEDIIGLRPGEAFQCIQSDQRPGGCGTTRACAACGAAIAILTSQEKEEIASGECSITFRNHEQAEDSIEFRVRATPLKVEGHVFTALIFLDISSEKRRQSLERVFYHDVLNTLTGLLGLSRLLNQVDGMDTRDLATRIVQLSEQVTKEIRDQRRLSLAESGSLEVESAPVQPEDILEDVESVFHNHEVARDRQLVIEPTKEDEPFVTDLSLLERVLINMIKNALEQVEPGETVRVRYYREAGRPRFEVHNPGEIPEHLSDQIFKRSFSTKGEKGRGLGTYSMKLFGERYLGGKVWFETSKEAGTRFVVELPSSPAA